MKTIVKILLTALIVPVLGQCKKDTNPFVTIPDDNFLKALIELGVDKNGNGIISTDEAALVHFLDVSHHNISDLKGIEAFVNLDSLYCVFNQLTGLDLSKSHELVYLECGWNVITSIDLSNCFALNTLYCAGNLLTRIDLSNNHDLYGLNCYANLLTSIDLSNNPILFYLMCGANRLTSLDLYNNPELGDLWCENNFLTNLDLSNNPKLFWRLYWGGNLLTSLDISNLTSLWELNLASMPSLSKVCVWTMPFPQAGVTVDTTGSPNVYFAMNYK